MVTEDKIKAINLKMYDLSQAFNTDKLEMDYTELKLREQDPEFWQKDKQEIDEHNGNVSACQNILTDYNRLKAVYYKMKDTYDFIQEASEMGETDETMNNMTDDMYNECIDIIDRLEMKKMLGEPEDNMNCIFSINAGAGGTEAQDWSDMLRSMYIKYFDSKGWKYKIMNINMGDGIGIKSIQFEINGEYSYGLLKSETGVHRLVRVSPFNAQGKRMTSFASVYAAPLVDDSIHVEIDESRISYDYFRSSGAGGQNVNKVSSGVRARYRYTDPDSGEEEEILVENTETRDQPKNKENARRILLSILYEKEMTRKRRKEEEINKSKKKIEWGSQIRSYVFDDSRVKDHRTGYEDRNLSSVMSGNIDGFIKAYLMM